MAVCKLTKDILRSGTCDYSLKQIVDIYIANYEDVTGTTLGETGNTVKTITMKNEGKFYHIEPNKDSASFEDSLQIGDAGSRYRATTLSFSYGGKYDGDTVDGLNAFSLGRFVAAAKLSDGTWVLFGRLTPLEASAASFTSAAEATGFNGQQITLTNNTKEPPLPLEQTAISTITGAPSV